jgi:hypothetical protein
MKGIDRDADHVSINEAMHTEINLRNILSGEWLSSDAEEGRDKLRYAPASSMYALNRRFLNANRIPSGMILKDRQRRELKRLSTCRKRNQLGCC